MGKLKPYWVSVPSGGYCEPDLAVLVFAHYTTEAKAVAHRETELIEPDGRCLMCEACEKSPF